MESEHTKCQKTQQAVKALQEKFDEKAAELERQKSFMQMLLTADKVNKTKQEHVSKQVLQARDQARQF